MGQSAAACKLARPRRHFDTCRRSQSTLDATVELRLGKKSARRLQDVVGPAQFLDFTLELPEMLSLIRGQPRALPCVNLYTLDPTVQGGDATSNLGAMDSQAAHNDE